MDAQNPCDVFWQVKLWDLSHNQPSCVASKNPKVVCGFLTLVSVVLFVPMRICSSHLEFSILNFLWNCVRELSFLFHSPMNAPFC